MACIKIADSLIPANTNIPADARTRVSTEADILTIENPAIGMLVYVEDNGITYIIKTLKASKVGVLTVKNKLVDTYEKFVPSKISELLNDKEYISREECIALIEEMIANLVPQATPAATLRLDNGTLVVTDNNPLDQFSPHIEDDILVLDDPNNSLDNFASVNDGTIVTA